MPLTYRTAGESHGPALTTIIEGLPAGLPLTPDDIDADLARRQLGYGRGGRQKIETDRVQVTAGIRHGRTLGSPVALMVMNRDFANWSEDRMAIWEPASEVDPITLPRPGHADLAGMQKYETDDLRNILERASARETAARVAAGGVAKALLRRYGMEVRSHVVQVGPEEAPRRDDLARADFEGVDDSPVRALDPDASDRMRAAIKAAGQDSDTLGGIFEVWVFDPIPGLGSHVSGDARLDGRALAACPDTAMQPVEIGCAIVFLDEEMKRRAVVPDVEGLPRLPDRYIACDPTHRIAGRADPLPCVLQRGVGQIEHGNIVKAVRQQRVDQA